MIALFDVDKTLIDKSYVHEMAFSYAFRKLYGVMADVHMINFHGKTDPQIMREVLQLLEIDENQIRMKSEDFLKCLSSYVRQNIEKEKIRLIEGVNDFLLHLDKIGIPMGLVTGNLQEIAFLKLKRAGIVNYFKFGGFGSDSPDRRSLVRIAVQRARELGYHGPPVVFGDTPHDMEAGKHVNAINVGISAGYYNRDDLLDAGADYVFSDFTEKGIFDVFIDRNTWQKGRLQTP